MKDKKILVNPDKRFLSLQNGVNGGGLSRNEAWIRYLSKKEYINYICAESYLKSILQISVLLFNSKRCKIFFLYPTVGFPVLNSSILGKISFKLFRELIIHASKHNIIIFDVCDLKYEQAIDLKIQYLDLNYIKKMEKKFFSLPAKFIFASESMNCYAIKKYGIKEIDTDYCINGGYKELIFPDLTRGYSHDTIKYVYAGTLNAGRMIKDMIIQFPENEKYVLILLGKQGEWILDDLNSRKINNVKYLGAFQENKAHAIVRRCDIGLIPYDNSRTYYNIAYPTKLSFYLTAGIPYLSTPVGEVNKIQNQYKCGFIEEINSWNTVIESITIDNIQEKKKSINELRNFYWDEIFDKCTFI